MSQRIAWVPYETAEAATEVLGEHPGVTYVPFTDNEAVPDGLDEVNFLVIPYAQTPTVVDRLGEMGALEVVQAQMAGTDDIVDRVPGEVILCNAAGLHDTATAELGVALALARSRLIDEFARDQVAGEWRKVWAPGLADQRITLVGYGHIGQAIERRLVGFEPASITRVATHARTEQVDGHEVEIRSVDDLPEIATQTDVLIIIMPLTDQTRGLVDADLLAKLPDGAMVVNMGRGPIVVTDDLLAACRSGRITAAMDVIDPEPVPADHPLRTTPGVLFSPHVGGWSAAFEPRRDALLRDQMGRWAGGQDLRNVVEH